MPAEIIGLGIAVPPYVLTNADLESLVDTDDQWITERTGIKERRIAGPDDSTSGLGRRAAQRALAAAGIGVDEVDLLIVATATPDYPLPSAACILQAELGMRGGAAMDVIAGCAGFVYAAATASNYIATGMARTALVVGAETLSRITDYTDRSTCILFGDGAGAIVLRAGDKGVRGAALGTDGSRAGLLFTQAGGSRLPASAKTAGERLHFMRMEGKAVFKSAVTEMAASSLVAIERSGLTLDDIDLVVPHQANQRIIDATTRRLKAPPERVVTNIARYGNTSAASIPIALGEAWEQGQVTPGQHVLFTAFGAGLAWGSMVVEWTLPPPASATVEEPTRSALPVIKGMLDGSLWAGDPPLPLAGRAAVAEQAAMVVGEQAAAVEGGQATAVEDGQATDGRQAAPVEGGA